MTLSPNCGESSWGTERGHSGDIEPWQPSAAAARAHARPVCASVRRPPGGRKTTRRRPCGVGLQRGRRMSVEDRDPVTRGNSALLLDWGECHRADPVAFVVAEMAEAA